MSEQVYPNRKVPLFKVLAFTQAGAAQNTWYTAFQGKKVEFDGLGVGITVADETVDIRITIDGTLYTSTGTVNLLFGSNKFATCITNGMVITSGTPLISFSPAAATLSCLTYQSACFRGASIKIEVRKTTNAGASALQVFGVYHQW